MKKSILNKTNYIHSKRNNQTNKRDKKFSFTRIPYKRDIIVNTNLQDTSTQNIEIYLEKIEFAKKHNSNVIQLYRLINKLSQEIKPLKVTWLYAADSQVLSKNLQITHNHIVRITNLKTTIRKNHNTKKLFNSIDNITEKLKHNYLLLEDRYYIKNLYDFKDSISKKLNFIETTINDIQKTTSENNKISNKNQENILTSNNNNFQDLKNNKDTILNSISKLEKSVNQIINSIQRTNKSVNDFHNNFNSNKNKINKNTLRLYKHIRKIYNFINFFKLKGKKNKEDLEKILTSIEKNNFSDKTKKILKEFKNKKINNKNTEELKKFLLEEFNNGKINKDDLNKAILLVNQNTVTCSNEIMFDISDLIQQAIGEGKINKILSNFPEIKNYIFKYNKSLKIIFNTLFVIIVGAIIGAYISDTYFSKDYTTKLENINKNVNDNTFALRQTMNKEEKLIKVFDTNLSFKGSKAILSKEKIQTIDEICSKYPEIQKVIITGFANKLIIDQYAEKNYIDNFHLSSARANTAKLALLQYCNNIEKIETTNIIVENTNNEKQELRYVNIKFYKKVLLW